MQFATFYLDSLYFGLDVMQVQEVLKKQDLTPVPLSSTVVRGLINLRGQIITAIDLRARIGMPPRADESNCMNLIVESDEGSISFLVDRVGDVIEVSERDLESTPSTLTEAQRGVVSGVYKLPGKLLLKFDHKKGMDLQLSMEGACYEVFRWQ